VLADTHGTFWLPVDGFSWNFVLEGFFKNLSAQFKVFFNSYKNDGYFTWVRMYVSTFMIMFCWITCGENQNIHFMFSNYFPRKSCCLWGDVEKCGRARHSPDDNIVQCRKTRFVCLILKIRMKTYTRTICYWLLIVNHCEICLCLTTMQREYIAAFPWQHRTLLYCWQLGLRQQQWKENVLLRVHGDSDYRNAPKCNVVRMLSCYFPVSRNVCRRRWWVYRMFAYVV
jgi:hypothetical protein